MSCAREANASSAFEEIDMEDFPIWLKLVIWGNIGLTVLYTILGHAPFLFAGLTNHRPGGWKTIAALLETIPNSKAGFLCGAIPFTIKLRYDTAQEMG
jgi:hypothetical protein